MSVWVYTVIKNESVLLPYFLRHYLSFCDRLIVYDDNSDDGSQELVRAAGAELRACPWSGIDDMVAASFANEQYKEARGQADWVIWVDGDEFIYHPDMKNHLSSLRQNWITLPRVDGYSMFAASPPSGPGQIYEELRSGIPDERYAKPVVVDPNAEIIWGAGKHEIRCEPLFRDFTIEPVLKLLHYRWLGREHFLKRNQHNWSVISPTNIQYGLGINVSELYDGHHSVRWYEDAVSQAQLCV